MSRTLHHSRRRPCKTLYMMRLLLHVAVGWEIMGLLGLYIAAWRQYKRVLTLTLILIFVGEGQRGQT